MPKLALIRRGAALAFALAALAVFTGSAFAATRFASPNGTGPIETQCTDPSLPCSLDNALQTAQDQDTLSLANGTYDITPKALPPVALHWVPTDPQTRPVIVSRSSTPTLSLTAPAQSGTTFDHLEIDNLVQDAITRENDGPSALLVGQGVSATVRSSAITGPVCISASKAGNLEIDDSTLNTTFRLSCLTLNKDSIVRRSTVGRQFLPAAMARRTPTPRGVAVDPPVFLTAGLVEDSTINEGLGLSAPTSVARRVKAIVTGNGPAIAGQGLIVDSLANGGGVLSPGIAAESDAGGTLVVLGSTAISAGSPALLSDGVFATDEPATANDLVVSNTIARGSNFDISASPVTVCAFEAVCKPGLIHIDHSDFTTRSPMTSEPGANTLVEGAGNIAGDPLFVDPAHGDFHLSAGSPAIDAGAVQDRELPTDLDGKPRVQGSAPDLGAFETPGLMGPGAGPTGVHGATGGKLPKLSRLAVSPSRFKIGKRATIVFSLDTSSSVTLTFQRRGAHHRFRTMGKLTVQNGHAGKNTVRFPSRLKGKRLKPGSYKIIALPAHGKPQSVRLTLMK
jgi:hypothetical protein